MKFISIFSFCALITAFIAACSGSPTPIVSPLNTGTTSPLPTSTPLALGITPNPGMGAVVGKLIDIRTNKPAVKTILYLEKSLNGDAPPILVGPLSNQPVAHSAENGNFVFNNVPPGEYVLALYSPIDVFYYQKPDGRAVLFQVQAGHVVDLDQVISYIP